MYTREYYNHYILSSELNFTETIVDLLINDNKQSDSHLVLSSSNTFIFKF